MEYGEFFPVELSPFRYNESMAMAFFPLTRDEALAKRFAWREPPQRNYKVGGDIVACAHGGSCNENCTEAFRVMPYEVHLCKTLVVSLPTMCPNCRFAEQIRALSFFHLYHRACTRCGKDVETSYAPERP